MYFKSLVLIINVIASTDKLILFNNKICPRNHYH